MNTLESYRRFCDTRREITKDFTLRLQDEYLSCYGDLQQLGAKSDTELQKIYGNYLQELQAAWSGDDSMQRAMLAGRNLQREYGRIQAEYLKERESRQRRMFDAINALATESTVKSFDCWIEHLGHIRQSAAGAESNPQGNEETA